MTTVTVANLSHPTLLIGTLPSFIIHTSSATTTTTTATTTVPLLKVTLRVVLLVSVVIFILFACLASNLMDTQIVEG